ncbi:MAG: hypothetical protein AAGG47_02370 [Pseudomonadota bacterium]
MTTEIRSEVINHMTVNRSYPKRMERGAKAIANSEDVSKELREHRGLGASGDKDYHPKWYTLANVCTGGILGYCSKTYGRKFYTGMTKDEMGMVGAGQHAKNTRALGRAHMQATHNLPKPARVLNRGLASDKNVFAWLLVNTVTLGHAHRMNKARRENAQADMPKLYWCIDVQEKQGWRPQQREEAGPIDPLDPQHRPALAGPKNVAERDVHRMIKDQKIAHSRLKTVKEEHAAIRDGTAKGRQARRQGESLREYCTRITTRDGSPELRSAYREWLNKKEGEASLAYLDFLEWSSPKLEAIDADIQDGNLLPEDKAGFTDFELAAIVHNYQSEGAKRVVNLVGVDARGDRIETKLLNFNQTYLRDYRRSMRKLDDPDPAVRKAGLKELEKMRNEAKKIPHSETVSLLNDMRDLRDYSAKFNEQKFDRFAADNVVGRGLVATEGGDPLGAQRFDENVEGAKAEFAEKLVANFPGTTEQNAKVVADDVFKTCEELSPGLKGNLDRAVDYLEDAEQLCDSIIDAQTEIQQKVTAHYDALRELGVPPRMASQATKEAFKPADKLHWRDKARHGKFESAMATADKAAAKQLALVKDLHSRVAGPMVKAITGANYAEGQAIQFANQQFGIELTKVGAMPTSQKEVDRAVDKMFPECRAAAVNYGENPPSFPPYGLKPDGKTHRIEFHQAALNAMSASANQSMADNQETIQSEPISSKLAKDVRAEGNIFVNGRPLPSEISTLQDEAEIQRRVGEHLGLTTDMTSQELASVTRIASQELGAEAINMCNIHHTNDANLRPTDLFFMDHKENMNRARELRGQTIRISQFQEQSEDDPFPETVRGKFVVEFENDVALRSAYNVKSNSEDRDLDVFYLDPSESTATYTVRATVDTNKPIGEQVEFTDVSIEYNVVPAGNEAPDIVMDLDDDQEEDAISVSVDPQAMSAADDVQDNEAISDADSFKPQIFNV